MRSGRLEAERRSEEAALVAAQPDAAPLLARLEEVYSALAKGAELSDALSELRGIYHGSTLLALGHALHEGAVEGAKPDAERETEYRSRNVPFLVKRLVKRLADVHPPHEAALLRRAAATAAKLPLGLLPDDLAALEAAAAGVEAGTLPPQAQLGSSEIEEILSAQVAAPADFVGTRVAAAIYPAYVNDRDTSKAFLSERDQLIAKLLELQKALGTEAFYPDANGCLRLSAGHVEGYSAADAVTHTPLTTLSGLVDKHVEATLTQSGSADGLMANGEFDCPPRLVQLCNDDAAAAATPACLLYSTDTVGGNSGSPVLDADGRFVAINFDRQRLGLMNEFKWSLDYSRSIGTCSQFILLLVGKYDGAQWLVDEMTDLLTK